MGQEMYVVDAWSNIIAEAGLDRGADAIVYDAVLLLRLTHIAAVDLICFSNWYS